jgi:hypothetical protein
VADLPSNGHLPSFYLAVTVFEDKQI